MNAYSNTSTLATLATLAVMNGVAACAAQTPAVAEETHSPAIEAEPHPAPALPPAPPAAKLDFRKNIERLRALRIFEVGALHDHVSETANCYSSETVIGVVCVQDLAARAQEIAVAEQKLADFTALAEQRAAAAPAGGPFGPGTNLEALRSLHLFEVGEFIVDQPESASCYGFCGPTNQKREAQLFAITEVLGRQR